MAQTNRRNLNDYLYTMANTGVTDSGLSPLIDQYMLENPSYNPSTPLSQEMFYPGLRSKFFGSQTPMQKASQLASAGGAFQYDPRTDEIFYQSHDDEFDWGNVIQGLLAAGVGGLAMSGAGLGAAAGGGGGGALGLEAGALTGTPGYGAALEGSLAGAGAGVPGVLDSVPNVPTGGGALGGGGGANVPPVAPPGPAATGGAGTTDWWSQYGLTPTDVGAATGGAAGAAGAGNALSRILGGTATSADWASVLGTAGSTALGILGSNQQADALRGIADQARTDRQPFLNKSLEWLNNPQAYQDGPGKSALDATLRALSVQGNPIGNPGNLAIAGDIANRGWQNAVTGFGNLGLAGQDSRSNLLASAAGADRGVTSSLASGLGSLTQPDNSMDALLKQLRGLGGGSQFGLV